jgi:hypothetical protein
VRHADEVVQYGELNELAEHALAQEVQRCCGADQGGGYDEPGPERPEGAARFRWAGARAHEERRAHGEQSGGAVVLLAEDARPEEKTGEWQESSVVGLHEAHEREQGGELHQQRRARVVVHVPVRERPDPVEEHHEDAAQCPARRHQPAQQQEDQTHEKRELHHEDPARHEVRGLEEAEHPGEEVERPRQGIHRGIAVELPAVCDQIGVEQDVPLVHEAEIAVEERKLVDEGDEDHRERRGRAAHEAVPGGAPRVDLAARSHS